MFPGFEHVYYAHNPGNRGFLGEMDLSFHDGLAVLRGERLPRRIVTVRWISGRKTGTVSFYLRVARTTLLGDGDLGRLTAHTVIDSILGVARDYSVAFTKYWVSAVRVLLRYLFVRGAIAVDLTDAIPAVAGWRLSGLPRDLDPAVVAQIVPPAPPRCDCRSTLRQDAGRACSR